MFDKLKARRKARKEIEPVSKHEEDTVDYPTPKGLIEKIGINLLIRFLTYILSKLK